MILVEEHPTLCSTRCPCSLPISPLTTIKKHKPGSHRIMLTSSKAALFTVSVVNMHDSRRRWAMVALWTVMPDSITLWWCFGFVCLFGFTFCARTKSLLRRLKLYLGEKSRTRLCLFVPCQLLGSFTGASASLFLEEILYLLSSRRDITEGKMTFHFPCQFCSL